MLNLLPSSTLKLLLILVLFAQKTLAFNLNHRESYKLLAASKGDLNKSLSKEVIAGVQAPQYDSILWTIAAALESRIYEREHSEWERVELKFPKCFLNSPACFERRYYDGHVYAYFQKAFSTSTKLYILLNSSYSGWVSGTWTNKMVAIINELDPLANILVLPGYLESEMLSALPKFPDPRADYIAADLYQRIQFFISQNLRNRIAQVGLIGFSGGASIALGLLREDSRFSHISVNSLLPRALYSKSNYLFNLGAIAFSPVMDPHTANATLDTQRKFILASGIVQKDEGLTTFGSMFRMFLENGFPAAKKILDFTNIFPSVYSEAFLYVEKLKALFINEFFAVDLASVKESYQSYDYVNLDLNENLERFIVPDGYAEYYERFAIDKVRIKEPKLWNSKFNEYTFSERDPELIEQNLTIVFPEDDPVLSHSSNFHSFIVPTVDKTRLKDILRSYSKQPNIEVFSPQFGGHMGYFLDTEWVKSLFQQKFIFQEAIN